VTEVAELAERCKRSANLLHREAHQLGHVLLDELGLGAPDLDATMAERGARCNREEDSMIGMAGRRPGSREESSVESGLEALDLALISRWGRAGGAAIQAGLREQRRI
jgi:hypothetical protein